MHLFWLTLFVPAVILSQWIWPILKQRSIWSLSAIVVGSLIIAWLAMGWPTLGSDERNFEGVLKMLAFRLAVSTDLPLVQMLVACVAGWLRSSPARITKPKPESGSPTEQPVLG